MFENRYQGKSKLLDKGSDEASQSVIVQDSQTIENVPKSYQETDVNQDWNFKQSEYETEKKSMTEEEEENKTLNFDDDEEEGEDESEYKAQGTS